MVAVFHAGLKLLGDDARAQLSHNENKHSISHGLDCLHEGGSINKTDTLI